MPRFKQGIYQPGRFYIEIRLLKKDYQIAKVFDAGERHRALFHYHSLSVREGAKKRIIYVDFEKKIDIIHELIGG